MNWFFSQRRNRFATVASVIFITLLGYATLKDTLQLALTGDDWLVFYTIRQIFDVQKSGNFFSLNTYLCTYCPHYSLYSLIKYFWGYDPYYYYLVSMVVRILVGITLYICTYLLTKKGFISLVVGSLWVTTYQGIQTSDWVFNFNHYAGVGLVAIFVVVYMRLQDDFGMKRLIAACILFCAAVIVSPPRMHGLVPFICLIEFSYLITQGKKYLWRRGIVRLVSILVVYKLLFVLAKGGYGTSDYNLNLILSGFKEMQKLLAKGQFQFFLYPIATIGNYFLPDITWSSIQKTDVFSLGSGFNSFKQLIVPISILLGLIQTILFRMIGVGRKYWLALFGCEGVWIATVYFVLANNRLVFAKENVVFSLVGGGMILFTFFAALAIRESRQIYSRLFLVSISWMIGFTLLPWILAPYAPLPTWMRYSVQQGAGLALWIGVVFALILEKIHFHSKKMLLMIFVFVALVMFQISNTRFYIDNLLQYRSQAKVQPLWDSLHKNLGQLPKDRFEVVYLTYDEKDYYFVEWGLRFGFSPRASIEFELDKNETIPLVVLDYKELISFVTDGAEFAKHGFPLKPIPLTDVYAFEYKDGKLINKTVSVRNDLKLRLAKTLF